ncbi:MAG: glycosyltransferase family 2 protein [Verrucomicrobia bacterium]|nr:glycosyltransferase family 2 protein [Verrucomicrobiota bacterium]
MRQFFILILCLFLGQSLPLSCYRYKASDVEIVVVIPSYNNKRYLKRNLRSVLRQDYPKWEMIYVNDCSTDNTGLRVEKFIRQHRLETRVKVIHNEKRVGAMANIYNAVQQIAPHKVVVMLDGDDELNGTKVLSRVARNYRNKKVWITYGNYRAQPKKGWTKDPCHAYPRSVLKKRLFRQHRWLCFPLRTFYAKLFHLIKKDDFMWNGEFLPVVSDVGYMFPMLEMASKKHILFDKKVQYIYHVRNPINDFRVNGHLMGVVAGHICSLPQYAPLKRLF